MSSSVMLKILISSGVKHWGLPYVPPVFSPKPFFKSSNVGSDGASGGGLGAVAPSASASESASSALSSFTGGGRFAHTKSPGQTKF